MDNSAPKTIGRFKIGRTLGDGGSCKVKLAYDSNNNDRKVAIKIMKESVTEQD